MRKCVPVYINERRALDISDHQFHSSSSSSSFPFSGSVFVAGEGLAIGCSTAAPSLAVSSSSSSNNDPDTLGFGEAAGNIGFEDSDPFGVPFPLMLGVTELEGANTLTIDCETSARSSDARF